MDWFKHLWTQRVPKGQFAQHILLIAGGTAVGQGIVAVATPLLTRIYTPEHFGLQSVFLSLVSILTSVVALRYEVAIILPEDDVMAANLLAVCLSVVVAMSTFVSIGVWLFGSRLLVLTKSPGLTPHLPWLLPLAVLGAGGFQVFSFWAMRKREASRLARMKVYQGCTQVVVQAGFPFVYPGSLGLLIGSALGYCGGVGSLARAAWQGEREQLKQVTLLGMREAAVRYRRFPMIGSISAMLNFTGVFLPPILISGLFDPIFAGQFALSQRVTAIPLALVGQAVSQVYIGEASKVIRANPEGLENLVKLTIRRLVQLGLLPVLAIAMLGPFGFDWIFGAAWKKAGWIGLWLAPMYLLQFVAVPISQTMNMLELQDKQLAWDSCRLVAVVAALVVPSRLGMSGMGTLTIYGVVMTIFYGILLISILRVSRGIKGIGTHV